jgi:hypothetical protein
MSPRVAIVIYSLYGHVATRQSASFLLSPFLAHNLPLTVAESVKTGLESAGGTAKIFQYDLFFLTCTLR